MFNSTCYRTLVAVESLGSVHDFEKKKKGLFCQTIAWKRAQHQIKDANGSYEKSSLSKFWRERYYNTELQHQIILLLKREIL